MKPIVSSVAFVIRLVVNRFGSVLMLGLRNRMEDKMFIVRIFEYSARKNRANIPPEYSTLNPDTSSDSPSGRSNGARFVSARVEIYHIIASGHVMVSNHVFSCVIIKSCRVYPPVCAAKHINSRPSVTSYDRV